ncbi:MAG: TPM domain-containing protein, partial [Planctomycetaceae bacterium]
MIQPSVRSAAAAASTLVVALVAVSTAAAWQLPAEVAGPRPAGRVVDTTGRLTADERREITALLDGIATHSRGDMMVVVIPTTAGVPHRQFATELFNRWRLGSAERDDGLLLFAALDDRRAEIILGDGLDDAARVAASQRVMDGVMIPEFKAGRPGGAIRRGALACAAEILDSPTESPATDTAAADANVPDVPVAVPDGLPAEPLGLRPARVPPVPAAPGPPWGAVAVLGGGLAATGVAGYGMWQFDMRRRRRACRR